jgi:hypothetical protein
MDDFQKLLFIWGKYDNQLKTINKNASELRSKKELISKQILPFIAKNNLEENIFKIPCLKLDIICKENYTYQSISFKFLEEKFKEYFNNDEKASKLLQFLKDNRNKEASVILKSNYTEEIDDE